MTTPRFSELDEYQSYICDHFQNQKLDDNTRIITYAMGCAGEGGEIVDHVKKWVGHGHELDKAKLKKEIGDQLWYCAALAKMLGFKLSDVATDNVEKLTARYPEAFSEERSRNRETEK